MSADDTIVEYLKVRPKFERLVVEIERLVRMRCVAHNLAFVSISGRAKAAASLENKIARKIYKNPLEEIHDLAGVRVVCSYQADAEALTEHLHELFSIHWEEDKIAGLGAQLMGYGGTHFGVSLGTKYAGGVYNEITDLKCEIQVRTVLQDAWAIINHHLVYKNEDAVPERLKRDLNNVASLLEVAQSVFDTVRQKKFNYEQEISSKLLSTADFLSQKLDLDTLTAYSRWKFASMEVSLNWSNRLLSDLQLESYPTLREIDLAVERSAPAVAAYKLEKPQLFLYSTDHITKSLGFVDNDFRRRHGFADVTISAFKRFSHLILPDKRS